jgi:hypothetical protein
VRKNISFEAKFRTYFIFSKNLQGPAIKDFYPVAEFLDPGWGDKVNSGIGLSYRPAKPGSLAGRYDNYMPKSTLSPQSVIYEFGYIRSIEPFKENIQLLKTAVIKFFPS